MTTEDNDRPYVTAWKRLSFHSSRYLDEKTRDINHQAIISDLAERTELSGSYLSSIILANLIALFGLLTNSVAVVIGAMLISPLMGPIFTLGLAFTMGDLALSRRAVRNIIYSVLLAVVMAALFTLLSPLKGATHEILSRTRPNIYDLLIAVIAGTAGALALCTRKNYLFTTTGVAVATAVIPPLSVVGYGMGTWQLEIAAGGFLLFFTNLVAIVISSNIVFYICRFRGSMSTESPYPIRRRFQILGSLLVIVSIPLIITLVIDIQKVKLTGQVETILKTYLNRQQQSRLTNVTITRKEGTLIVTASVNTLKYIDSTILKKIERELTDKTGDNTSLELEQVIVRSGAVDPAATLRPPAILAASPQPAETLATLHNKTMTRINEGCREIDTFISPYKTSDCSITFSDQQKPIGIMVTIKRDYAVNSQELGWLTNVLKKQLGEMIELKVETVPLLPPISFNDKDEIAAESRKAMEPLKQIFAQLPASGLIIEVPADNRRTNTIMKRRVERLKEYLVHEPGISADHITTLTSHEKVIRVKISAGHSAR